jgi:formate dehydrogenase maturation protein FdhE
MGTARHPPRIDTAVGLVLPDDIKAQLQAELDALARLEGTEGVAPDYARFCERVARSQAATRAATRATALAPSPSAARRVSRDLVTFDRELLRDLLRDLSGSAGDSGSAEAHLRILAAAADDEPALLEQLATAVVFEDDARLILAMARRLAVPAPALVFMGRLLAAPFVAESRYRRGPVPELDARNFETTEAGCCPACASIPTLALLCRDDGRRRLLCGLCGETWVAPRLMCPACGTRDQSWLGTLSVRGTDARWVETCDACRRYVKTVDQRRLPEDHVLVPRAEEAASLYLDLMAEEAGYVRSDCHPSLLLEITT